MPPKSNIKGKDAALFLPDGGHTRESFWAHHTFDDFTRFTQHDN